MVAIDGKTICGSGNSRHKAYHVISAFVVEAQITLGELTVEEKTNEITAVPELLDLIDVEDSIVTADAMSCQKKIVEKITHAKADYTIGLKQNQPTLYKDCEEYFQAFSSELPFVTTQEKGHGRIVLTFTIQFNTLYKADLENNESVRRSSKDIAPMGAMPRTSKSHTGRTQEQRSSHGLFVPQSGMSESVFKFYYT